MTDGYTETRYYTMSNDNYTTYRDLVELNTKYNVVNSDSTVNANSFIDDRLYQIQKDQLLLYHIFAYFSLFL